MFLMNFSQEALSNNSNSSNPNSNSPPCSISDRLSDSYNLNAYIIIINLMEDIEDLFNEDKQQQEEE